MSSTNFKLTFTMSDGSVIESDKSIDGILFSGDDISDSTVTLTNDTKQINNNSTVSFLLQKSFLNSVNVKSGSLVSDLVSAIKTTFVSYNSSYDISNTTTKQWIESTNDITISISGNSNPSVDVFDQYIGKYSFTVVGSPDQSSILEIPQIDSNGNIVNNQITLRNGDSITIFGLEYNSNIVYNIINENINSTKNIVVISSLSKTGDDAVLNIPEIGIKFNFSYTNNSGFNVTVYPIASTPLPNVDLRRYSIWNGGSVETYTINGGSIPVSGTNIDNIAYSNSQDVSTVLVSTNLNVWKVTYWASGNASRFRAMAEKFFV